MQGIAYNQRFQDSQALPFNIFRAMSLSSQQENFVRKLRHQMKRLSMGTSAVGAHFGIRPQSVDGWLRTGRAGKDKLRGLSELFGTSLDYWLEESDPESEGGPRASVGKPAALEAQKDQILVWETEDELPEDDNRVWVDRWDYFCSAGDGVIQWEIRQKAALPFTKDFFKAIGSKPENCRLISVRGRSMEPYLFDKDMAMVDVSKITVQDGTVYALMFEDESLVKQVFKEPGGGLTLHSFNEREFKDKRIEPGMGDSLCIVGEIVYRSGAGLAAR